MLLVPGDDGTTPGAHAAGDFGDIHGLAVHPERPNELYVATHHGLYRGVDDANWARVGDVTDDLMGFSMHPTNGSTLWTSGHPATPTQDAFNLGVRVSHDGGHTWETIALEGVDFHAMTVSPADPDRLWGFYRGELYRSLDGGYDWNVVDATVPQRVLDLTADPLDPETVYAATPTGIHRSPDGGTTWETFADLPAAAVAFHPQDPAVAYAASATGVQRSRDGGDTWSAPLLAPDGETPGHIALDPQNPSTVYVGTYEAGIHKSDDGGDTWRRVKTP